MNTFRKLLLTFVINASAVALVTTLLPGMSYVGGAEGIITITLVLAGVNVLIKPALSLLSLPVEIATVAVVGLFVNAAMLYILALNLQGFTIFPFQFPGLLLGWFLIAPFGLPPYGTAFVGALSISVIVAVLSWLTGLSGHKSKHH